MSKTKLHGVVMGLTSGITWALYTLILYTVLDLYGMSRGDLTSKEGIILIILTACTIAFVDSVITLITEIIMMNKMNLLSEFTRTLFSRKSLGILPAAILAGPLGLIPYSIASYQSASLAGAISATYPVIGAIAASIFLNQKMNKTGYLGVIMVVLSSIVMYNITVNDLGAVPFILSVISAFGWGLEAVFGCKLINDDINPVVTISMRHSYSLVIYIVTIVVCSFMIKDFSYADTLVTGFSLNASLFSMNVSWLVVMLIFVLGSVFGAISYVLWYSSMKYLGVAPAMVLNVSYGVWIVIISLILGLESYVGLNVLASSILMLLGCSIVIKTTNA